MITYKFIYERTTEDGLSHEIKTIAARSLKKAMKAFEAGDAKSVLVEWTSKKKIMLLKHLSYHIKLEKKEKVNYENKIWRSYKKNFREPL